MIIEPGTKVSVWSGDGQTALGIGTYLGEVSVHFFRMPDGSLRSLSDAEIEPPAELLTEMEALGAQHVTMPGNPQIQLDNRKIVYGCQVWWSAIQD